MADEKKSFRNGMDAFLSESTLKAESGAPAEPTEPAEPKKPKKAKKEKAEPVTVIPDGYMLVPEAKTRRVQLLLRPTSHAKLKALADVKGVSFNELVNTVLDEYIERNKK